MDEQAIHANNVQEDCIEKFEIQENDENAQTEQKSEEEESQLSEEEQASKIKEVIFRNPSQKEIHLKLLRDAKETKSEEELFEIISSYPEAKNLTLPKSGLIEILVKYKALERKFIPDENQDIDDQSSDDDSQNSKDQKLNQNEIKNSEEILDEATTQINEVSEEEITPQLKGQNFYTTTAAGLLVYEDELPTKRIVKLMNEQPQYAAVMTEILKYCIPGHTLPEINSEFENRKELSDPKIYPSALVDFLENAGALVWDQTWITTSLAQEYLEGKE